MNVWVNKVIIIYWDMMLPVETKLLSQKGASVMFMLSGTL